MCNAKTDCMSGDLLNLLCGVASSKPHLHCFDCLQDAIEHRIGYNETYLYNSIIDYPLLDQVVLCRAMFEASCT